MQKPKTFFVSQKQDSDLLFLNFSWGLIFAHGNILWKLVDMSNSIYLKITQKSIYPWNLLHQESQLGPI